MDAKTLRERFIGGLKRRIQKAEKAEDDQNTASTLLGENTSIILEPKVEDSVSPMMAKFGFKSRGKK